MAQIFAAFGKFSQNNKGSVQNFGIIGITVTAEEITKFIFFFCPCNYPMNQVYGTTFIWGPAAILLVVGYVVNRRTWRLMTGMCNRTQGVGRGGKRIIHFLFIFCNISMKAVIAPATWIVLSFLKGDYYACAAWPDASDPALAWKKFNLKENTSIPAPCIYKDKPTFFKSDSPAEIIARDLRAYSHIIGWWFLSWTVLIGIFVVFVFRCMSKYSYEQSKYIEKYRAAEMRLFDEALDAKAQAQAKIIVDQYFTKPRAKEEWDQIAAINDKVMKSKRGKPIYSPLHKFSNKELVAMELAHDDIVTNSAQKKRHLSDLLPKMRKTAAKKPTEQRQPTTAQSQAPAASATMMPMIAMAPTQKIRVKNTPSRPPANTDQPQGSAFATPSQQSNVNVPADVPNIPQSSLPQSTNIEAEVSPRISTGSRPPSYNPSLEDDPIKEANVPSRSSIILPVVDNDEDPILEANIAEQADEIRRSMQNLEIVEDDVQETAIEMGSQEPFQDDDDDSEPLL